ncbi:MAG: DNA double-strand break repair nuclease NurA [Chloroflexota bacterium]
MTLDMLKVSTRVSAMAGDIARRQRDLRHRLTEAREILVERAPDWEALAQLAQDSKRRLPRPLEPLDTRVAPARELERDHVVIATDGSQIEPDRHGAADYFLLNVGWAVVRYGTSPFAELSSEPTLYFGPDQTQIVHQGRRVPIQDHLLSAKRAGLELGRAASLASEWQATGLTTLVLADGTLLLWVLEDRPDDFLREELVGEYVHQLDRIRTLGVPLASYVSRPRSAEVATLLRESDRQGDLGKCSACASSDDDDDACVFERLPDRELFGDLPVGERSALFAMTMPRGLQVLYGDHAPWFFYLNVGSEIARVEVPPWTADDPDRLSLVQSAILDQCQKGLGYPNVLARAHEQAVVTGQDRLAFEYLLEAVMAREGVPARPSEKLHSKRVRAV